MWEDAISELQNVLSVEGDTVYTLGQLGWAFACSGKQVEALKVYKRMDELSKERYVSHVMRSLVSVGLDNKDQAIKHLEKACLEREPLLAVTHRLLWWDSLRSDPRFKEILKKMGLE
jgi:hypothetical protein